MLSAVTGNKLIGVSKVYVIKGVGSIRRKRFSLHKGHYSSVLSEEFILTDFVFIH
jgi:hypothetical protein